MMKYLVLGLFAVGAVAQAAPIFTSDPWPAYRSMAECQANLEKERVAFTETTGLSPISAVCSAPKVNIEYQMTYNRFTPIIKAKGTPNEVLRSVAWAMTESHFSGGKAELQAIANETAKVGLPLKSLFLAPGGPSSSLWMRFRVPATTTQVEMRRKFLLKNSIEPQWATGAQLADPMRSHGVESCYRQLNIAKETFKDFFTSPVVWWCMTDPFLSLTRLYHLRIKPGVENVKEIEVGQVEDDELPESYPSFQKCEADKTRVIEYYRTLLPHDNVVGALCSSPTVGAVIGTPSTMFIYIEEK